MRDCELSASTPTATPPGLAIGMPLEEPYLKLKSEAEATRILHECYG